MQEDILYCIYSYNATLFVCKSCVIIIIIIIVKVYFNITLYCTETAFVRQDKWHNTKNEYSNVGRQFERMGVPLYLVKLYNFSHSAATRATFWHIRPNYKTFGGTTFLHLASKFETLCLIIQKKISQN